MTYETSKTPSQDPAVRGVELLMQRQNLLHEAAAGYGSDAKLRAFEALDAFDSARTDEEWEAMRVAQFGAGKVGLHAMAKQYGEFMPIGQRR